MADPTVDPNAPAAPKATINGGMDPQAYALANGGQANMSVGGAQQPVNYGFQALPDGFNQNGNYSGIGVTSDIYGAANQVNHSGADWNQGFTPTDMGNYVDPSIAGASFGLTSGTTQNNTGGANSILRIPLQSGGSQEVGMWAAGQNPGTDTPYALDKGYAWQNGKIVADPNSLGYATDRSGNLVANTASSGAASAGPHPHSRVQEQAPQHGMSYAQRHAPPNGYGGGYMPPPPGFANIQQQPQNFAQLNNGQSYGQADPWTAQYANDGAYNNQWNRGAPVMGGGGLQGGLFSLGGQMNRQPPMPNNGRNYSGY